MKFTVAPGSKRPLTHGLFYLVLGTAFVYLAWSTAADAHSALRFSKLGTLKIPSQWAFFLAGGLTLACGPACLGLARRKPWVTTMSFWLNGAVVVAFILLWASMGRRIDVVGLATQSLRLATPVALGAMAGILCERSGVINIAIEGMMLAAACIGYTAALYTQCVWIGLAAALAGGMAMAALHAVLSIRFLVDQIISATVINILAVGVTGFIRRGFLVNNPLDSPALLPMWRIPGLSDIPIIGQIFFRHQPMVYTMLALILVLHIMLFYTRWGLRTRTAGENPRAADTLGINVIRIRYQNVILSGAVAGLAGAWFSLETVGRFDNIMTGGKGFIALAAMIFGKWTPFGALGGALLFGSADALQIKLQISGVQLPYQFLSMTPYIVTMIVLAGIIGRATAPAAIGTPYKREG